MDLILLILLLISIVANVWFYALYCTERDKNKRHGAMPIHADNEPQWPDLRPAKPARKRGVKKVKATVVEMVKG